MHRSILMASLAFAVLLSVGAGAASRGLTVGLSQLIRVPLHGAAANVVVADPTIADARIIDSHSIVLLGKGYGVTQVLVTDHDGRTLLDSRVAVLASDLGRVTVYRGQIASDYGCAGHCQTMASAAAATQPTAQSTPSGAPPAPPPQQAPTPPMATFTGVQFSVPASTLHP